MGYVPACATLPGVDWGLAGPIVCHSARCSHLCLLLHAAAAAHCCTHAQGLGYVFSASLPPYLAVAGIHVLEHLRQNGKELLPLVRSRAHALRRELSKVPGKAGAIAMCRMGVAGHRWGPDGGRPCNEGSGQGGCASVLPDGASSTAAVQAGHSLAPACARCA